MSLSAGKSSHGSVLDIGSTATAAPQLHRLAQVLAGLTLVLIFAGGLVTSTGSALAVPDWPLSFGKFFPEMKGGVLYEHGHRMIAGTVAMLTLALAVWVFVAESRRWVRRLAAGTLALVLVQAVLGGITVLWRLPLAIAVAHAATAQAFFCLAVAIAMVTNPSWEETRGSVPSLARTGLPRLAAVTTLAIYLQILIGALMRHMGAGLAIPDFPLSYGHLVPPRFNWPIAVNYAHRLGALVCAVMISWTGLRCLTTCPDYPRLTRLARALLTLLPLQIALGATTVWSGRAVIPTTAHVATGALVLATSFALTLRCYHLADTTPGRATEPLDEGGLVGPAGWSSRRSSS